LLNVLQQIATALDSVYVEIVSFAYDGTYCWISPTSGHWGSAPVMTIY